MRVLVVAGKRFGSGCFGWGITGFAGSATAADAFGAAGLPSLLMLMPSNS
jgi:hypothetical protein